MIGFSIETYIRETLRDLINRELDSPQPIILEIPRSSDHGELSCSIAMSVAGRAGIPPRTLAEKLARDFPTSDDRVVSVEVAGPGFLNFHLGSGYFYRLLAFVIDNPAKFGDSDEGKGERWHFEYVSANPTGPLNIVNARAASVGDTLTNVFRKSGYAVHREFYMNDSGGQIRKLGASIFARMRQIESGSATADIPDGGYHGDYVLDIARDYLKQPGVQVASTAPDDETAEKIGLWAAEKIRTGQEDTLNRFLARFDRWFRESMLNEPGDRFYKCEDSHTPRKVLEDLNKSGLTYKKDGALFFKAGSFGDSDDRVVETSQGRFTYIVPDIAYHLRKHRHFNRAVNLLGPDHHGHILQLRASLKALLGKDREKDFFKPIIVQQVNLKRDGEDVKMSKRAGVGITMQELIDEVGVDAARFFFLRRKISSHLDFDIGLASRHSDENPVYYVQYAHARIKSILRQPAVQEIVSQLNQGNKADAQCIDLSVLTEPEELNLMKVIARFPWTLAAIVRSIEPHPLTTYLEDLAKAFHLFYAKHRVICDDRDLTAARLQLCRGVAGVLAEGLRLMGVSAPDRM